MLTHKQRAGKRKARLKQEQERNNSIAAGWRLVLKAVNDSLIISAAALHDEFGFSNQRLKRYLNRFETIFDTCIEPGEELDVDNILKVLQEEDGIKREIFPEYKFGGIVKDV